MPWCLAGALFHYDKRPFTFKELKYLPQDISKGCTTVLDTSSRHNWIIETLSCFILYFLHTAAEFWNRKRYSILFSTSDDTSTVILVGNFQFRDVWHLQTLLVFPWDLSLSISEADQTLKHNFIQNSISFLTLYYSL